MIRKTPSTFKDTVANSSFFTSDSVSRTACFCHALGINVCSFRLLGICRHTPFLQGTGRRYTGRSTNVTFPVTIRDTYLSGCLLITIPLAMRYLEIPVPSISLHSDLLSHQGTVFRKAFKYHAWKQEPISMKHAKMLPVHGNCMNSYGFFHWYETPLTIFMSHGGTLSESSTWEMHTYVKSHRWVDMSSVRNSKSV